MNNIQSEIKTKLHGEALRSLIAIQYYLSQLSREENENQRSENYKKSLQAMNKASELLLKTAPGKIEKTIENIETNCSEELTTIIYSLINLEKKIKYEETISYK